MNQVERRKLVEKKDLLKCAIAYNKYGGYCVPLSSQHRPAAQMILSGQVYEPETIQYMLNNCNDGDVVHAGTYFGDFLPALSSGLSVGAKVWTFEPCHENYRCAKITVEINTIENVTLMHAGLGGVSASLLVKTISDEGLTLGGGSRIVKGGVDIDEGLEPVSIVTVDDVVGVDRRVSIIQLDVEGYEQEALVGAMKMIRRCLPYIIIEVLEDSTLLTSDWFNSNIISLGYVKIGSLHGNVVFSCSVAS